MYEAKSFTIPALQDISQETINEHLGLYAGYVKHVNHIINSLKDVSDPYAKREMQRRLGFEFGGMKNHEYYFSQFEGGHQDLKAGKLRTMIEKQFGSLEDFIELFKETASTRGVGWAMCYIDRQNDSLVVTWVDEQQLGQLADVDIVLALDMWEHSYMLDYPPSKKQGYIDAFFLNLNWEVVTNRV
ncbi:superoxide dismutase [bacterium]|nr:superoxide dismutase [bacterium]|tara:strand:- start:267 stop:824 length:558 start_codon:yes stop_codon:yes gene_type:complete